MLGSELDKQVTFLRTINLPTEKILKTVGEIVK